MPTIPPACGGTLTWQFRCEKLGNLRLGFVVMDNRTPQQRSETMRQVRTKDTGIELKVRGLLHSHGYRYRLHVKLLPGSPDIVFTARKKVIFVHGCFWHWHGCNLGRAPRTRLEYWKPKLTRNRIRDANNRKALENLGWKTMTVWQCEILDEKELVRRLTRFLGPQRC